MASGLGFLSDSFGQAMLKTTLETTPLLTKDNYGIWKDKMMALLKFRGVLKTLESKTETLASQDNDKIQLLLISKVDSVTHNNVISATNINSAKEIWQSIKERFSLSQASNRAQIFNNFLHITFQGDNIMSFVTNVKTSIKKMINIGIELPNDILAYLTMFKFLANLQDLKPQLMHSDRQISVIFVCNHLIEFHNKVKAEQTK